MPPDTPFPHGYDFSGKVAIITGGGTGIGAATALLLARYGADTVIAGRTPEPLETTARKLHFETGRDCLAVPTDVRREEAVEALVKNTIDRFGRIDILVNNAGGARGAPLKNISSKQWHNAFNLNLHAAFYCTNAVAPYLLEQKSGCVINVSSMAGITGTKGVAPYSAAKCGLQMYTRVAAAEWGPRGIRVNCVAVGAIASEGAVENWKKGNLDMEAMSATVPLKRLGKPEDAANAIVFLASDAASYISGETLAVSGGPVIGGFADT